MSGRCVVLCADVVFLCVPQKDVAETAYDPSSPDVSTELVAVGLTVSILTLECVYIQNDAVRRKRPKVHSGDDKTAARCLDPASREKVCGNLCVGERCCVFCSS